MEELKKKIKDKGLKQSWIAEQLEKTPQELTMWLNGTRPMPDDIKKKILDIIG